MGICCSLRKPVASAAQTFPYEIKSDIKEDAISACADMAQRYSTPTSATVSTCTKFEKEFNVLILTQRLRSFQECYRILTKSTTALEEQVRTMERKGAPYLAQGKYQTAKEALKNRFQLLFTICVFLQNAQARLEFLQTGFRLMDDVGGSDDDGGGGDRKCAMCLHHVEFCSPKDKTTWSEILTGKEIIDLYASKERMSHLPSHFLHVNQ